MAFGLAAYVSRFRARLASRCWSSSPGRAFTRRVPKKGFQNVSYISSSFSKLLGTIPFSAPGVFSVRTLRLSALWRFQRANASIVSSLAFSACERFDWKPRRRLFARRNMRKLFQSDSDKMLDRFLTRD